MKQKRVLHTSQGFKSIAKTRNESYKVVYCFSTKPIPLDNKVF